MPGSFCRKIGIKAASRAAYSAPGSRPAPVLRNGTIQAQTLNPGRRTGHGDVRGNDSGFLIQASIVIVGHKTNLHHIPCNLACTICSTQIQVRGRYSFEVRLSERASSAGITVKPKPNIWNRHGEPHCIAHVIITNLTPILAANVVP